MTIHHNRRAWGELVARQQCFTRPARDEDFVDPLAKVDPLGWLGGDIRGKTLLCLAAGGGKHGPLYAAAGANVTVVDLSPASPGADGITGVPAMAFVLSELRARPGARRERGALSRHTSWFEPWAS